MLASLARSTLRKQCRLVAATTTRAMSTAVAESNSEPDFDGLSWTEEELDAELEALDLPHVEMAIMTETEDSYDFRVTEDKEEFLHHLVDFCIHNEFTDHVDSRPYSEALDLDFRKKTFLGATFALAALSNEWYVCNEETIIMAAFISAVVTTKVVLGPKIVKWYEEYKSDSLRDQNEAEDAHIWGCKTVLEGIPVDKIHSNLESMFEEEKGVIELEAKARVIEERNDLINNYKQTLDKLVVAKNEAANKEYQTLLSQTVTTLREDAVKPAFRKKALKYALDAATNKPAGPDPTVKLFDTIFKRLSK